jgi:hypothetical protein
MPLMQNAASMSALMADVAEVLPLLLSRLLSSLHLSHLLSLLTSALQLRAELGDIKGLLQNQTALIQHLASRRTSSPPAATPTLNLPVRIWCGPGFMLPWDCFCCIMAAQIPIHMVCVCVCVCARVSFDPSATCDQMTGTFEARCKHQNRAWHHPDTTDSCRTCWRCRWCW